MTNINEEGIMKNWDNNHKKPLVSIICTTYNHEPYITDAIQGFLRQETDFSFEILIRDDCSTDKTAEIIKQYEKQYPQLIKPVYEVENTFSKGIKPMPELFKKAQGDYIALCEGDDYWTDKNKLQIQVDIFKQYKTIDMCFHQAMKIDMRNQKKLEIGVYLNDDGVVSVEDIILKSKGQIPTASMLIRKNVLEDLKVFYSLKQQYKVGDIFMQFFSSKRGGAYFVKKTMSVYRHYTEGSWSSNQLNNNYEKKILSANSRIQAYEDLDEFENNNFTLTFKEANKKRALVIIKEPSVPYFTKLFFILKHRKYFMLNEQLVYLTSAVIPISSYIPDNVYQYLKKLFKMPSRMN